MTGPLAKGPNDEFDDETSGDPDSTLGEESEDGFDEMADWPDPLFVPDDGIEDFEDEEGEDDEFDIEEEEYDEEEYDEDC